MELLVELVPIADLKFDDRNARKHSPRNIEAIKESLKAFGQRKPLVVSADGTVIAGNGTLEAAKALGWKQVSVSRVPENWTAEQVRAYALADNRSAELAEWDTSVLANELVELDTSGWDLSLIGFDKSDMGVFDVSEAEAPLLDSGDKKPFRQITFTLHEEQALLVEQAIAAVKLNENLDSSLNSNAAANAITAICRNYLDSL